MEDLSSKALAATNGYWLIVISSGYLVIGSGFSVTG